jgi:phosphopantetheine adenylyltransferase
MDMFSRTHTQEMRYAAEQKVEGYLTKRREEKKLENKKRIEPLLIQNDQNLKEGIINKEMHAVREKQYLEKMEDITPLEEKIGKGVKREATSAFGILNEMATSPEARNKINAQRVKEGKAPLQSAMDDNSIAATFARGVASTSKQLHTKPAKSQPAIFTRGTEAPKFSGAAMHSLPTSSSFYGVGVGTVAAPRKGKGSRSGVSQKGGNPINFGGVGGGGFGGGGAPISFGSGFGLFGRGQPAPAPAPVKRKKR